MFPPQDGVEESSARKEEGESQDISWVSEGLYQVNTTHLPIIRQDTGEEHESVWRRSRERGVVVDGGEKRRRGRNEEADGRKSLHDFKRHDVGNIKQSETFQYMSVQYKGFQYKGFQYKGFQYKGFQYKGFQ